MRRFKQVWARAAPRLMHAWLLVVRLLRTVRAAFARLNGVDWANMHVKLAGAVWAILLFLLTPSVVAASLGSVLVWVMTGFMLVGAIISSAGLVVASRDHEHDPVRLRIDLRRSLFGLGVELVGLVLMLSGVLLYFVTQGVLSVVLPTGVDRVALTAFAYYSGAQTLARVVSVVHRRRKETRLAGSIGGTT
ncbi:hypothetical protein SOM10_11750 [Microbacterium sp. CFBP9023]|uniref:hypothetical protein n=1 Tax=Microbacterium sp. CFBP9023 TaxID=3096535 RepID=UPI002A69AEA8|nr:hypothetical protein [Microbacterium sp. CFBP9023]MDY0984570.1 hypothetical protein [Microbacterium sp. CFBP9023]